MRLKMNDSNQSRDASATIQGYLFQFDATILSLCSIAEDAIIDIEGIEDFDVVSSDIKELFQCKYYEATRLTSATIRDGILPMLKGFLKLPQTERPRRRFHLYGYFRDSARGDTCLDPERLKTALTHREAVKNGQTMRFVAHDLQKELQATDDDIKSFANQLTIHVTGKAEDHRRETMAALQRLCGLSATEIELYTYPTARTLISSIACNANPSERRLSKIEFISRISPSKALFNHWSLREHGETAYCSRIRSEYFSHRNIDAIHRIFILDARLASENAEIQSLCHAIRAKWSSHAMRRKPDKERYVPILFIRNLAPERMVDLKGSLHQDGVRFVDGYPFLGSTFTVDNFLTPQTFENNLSLRLLSSQEELSKTLSAIRTERIVYDFYSSSPADSLPNSKWISVPVKSIGSIEKII